MVNGQVILYLWEEEKFSKFSESIQHDLTFLPERSNYFPIPRIVKNVQDLSIFLSNKMYIYSILIIYLGA